MPTVYDLLEVIESQIKAFGYTIDEIGHIPPMLGKNLNNMYVKEP